MAGEQQRIEVVDALRGFALLGLLLVHCVERFELYWLNPQPDPWFDAVFAVFSSKAYAMFALLFGFSFATIMANERARGGDFSGRFVRRLLILLVIGLLHGLIYRGEILQVLAVIGLVLVPTDRIRSNRLLLIGAAIMLVQLPLMLRGWAASRGIDWAEQPPLFWGDSGLGVLTSGSFADMLSVNVLRGMVAKWSFYLEGGRATEIVGLFLIGMVLQRTQLFAQARERRGAWIAILIAGGALWALASFIESRVLPFEASPMTVDSVTALLTRYRAVGATFFQVALFVLLWHSPIGKPLALLAPSGRMTLTLYVMQSLVFVWVFYGFGLGLYDDLSNRATVILGLAAFAVQIVLAVLWFRSFRYGPLEWLWRAGTIGSFATPLRRSSAGAV
ncbi:MAG: DUF418 domain-containing protein [Rhizobiales bacterium]|nr:DUF418 domain-containing protein [Hyphomicrobiales bacterium]